MEDGSGSTNGSRRGITEPAHKGDTGIRIEAQTLDRTTKNGVALLQGATLVVEPGELIGIVGGSGAGKTTLLEALAGISPPTSGRVLFDGIDLYRNQDLFRTDLGYVPQDDIIHTDLPLRRTLRYAARLRVGGEGIDGAVDDALRTLDLAERADTKVAALSGGQRKRASIAVELLTKPRVFFLDEPTSGLDPSTSAELLGTLRSLADSGTTVLFTTHAIQDLRLCRRVMFLARGGRIAFAGTLDDALGFFEVQTVEEIYGRLATYPEGPALAPAEVGASEPAAPQARPQARAVPGMASQFGVLFARALETMVRNKLTLAILLGSPAMIVAMFVILFKADAFSFTNPDPTSILMILFWVSFGSFFFGVTYGLLQVVTERAIVRREHLVGLRLTSYLLSKVAVLLPFLLVVNIMMLSVLRALDRLPDAGWDTYGSLVVTPHPGGLCGPHAGAARFRRGIDTVASDARSPDAVLPRAVLFSERSFR